jgi:hypothetical protein
MHPQQSSYWPGGTSEIHCIVEKQKFHLSSCGRRKGKKSGKKTFMRCNITAKTSLENK